MLGGVGAALGAGLAGDRAWAAADFPSGLFDADSKFSQGGWARGKVVSAEHSQVMLETKSVQLGRQGHFFIAFDRDAPTSLSMMVRNYDVADAFSIPIAPRHWQVETIDAPFHPPEMPDAEFARIRAGELARIDVARRHETDAGGWRQNFNWPAKGRVSGLFGAQRIYRGTKGAYHPGLDIALPAGTPFGAPSDGVVILAADHPFTLEGNLLMVDHGMGLNSAFLHCSKLQVREGDRVAQGQPLGLVGMTGRATGPHLHWALKWREARLDPLLFIA